MIKKFLYTMAAGVLWSGSAFAQGVSIPNPLEAGDFGALVGSIINFLFNIGLVVAPIMIIIAGFILVTGGGDPKAFQRAKDLIIYTVAGLFLIMVAGGLINVVKDLVTD